MYRTLLILALLIVLNSQSVSGAVLRVPADFQTVQTGIDHSDFGDTVLVSPGRYQENINFFGRGITVGSWLLIGGGEFFIDSTIIDGGQNGSVVRFDEVGDSASALIGFTLTNGTGSRDESGDICGGGIHCYRASPRLEYLKIKENRARFGGGIFIQSASPKLKFVEVSDNQARNGGGIYCSARSYPLVQQSLVCHNTIEEGSFGGGGVVSYALASPVLKNVTITDNDSLAILLINADITILNLITWNDPIAGWASDEGHQPIINIDYCDVEGGRNNIRGPTVNWGQGNIDNDPMFIDPANRDYTISANSPCKDTGDPNEPNDLDGSRSDMGYGGMAQLSLFTTAVSGQVFDSETGLPIPEAMLAISCDETAFRCSLFADSSGAWTIPYFPMIDSVATVELGVSAAGYLPQTIEVEVSSLDSNWVETNLDHADFIISEDSLFAYVDTGGTAEILACITNGGNGPLSWRAVCGPSGSEGTKPWTTRQDIPAELITGNQVIQGVAFDGESFYCAGFTGNDSNMISQISRAGVLLSSFLQPGHSRYGFRDLEWDGELIWGSGEDTVFAINREGEVIHRWLGPNNPTKNIAFDPNRGILWLSGITTDFYAFDQAGNNLGERIDNQGLRTYGLAWFENDPDSSCLYALTNSGGDSIQINKFQPNSGIMTLVTSIELDSAESIYSAYICRSFDRYKDWVFMTCAGFPTRLGGDQLRIWQLEPNSEWVTVDPDSGTVPPNGEVNVTVTVSTRSERGDWKFGSGDYNGEIVFSHDGRSARDVLPIHLTVTDPNPIEARNILHPPTYDLTSIYPNPFNHRTAIRYSVPNRGEVRVAAYDVSGRLVKELYRGDRYPGEYSILWQAPAAGVYLIQVETDGGIKRVEKGVCLP